MEENIKQEKHEIALLTELTLYNRIRALDTDSNLDEESKEKKKEQAIEVFVQYCVERYKTLMPEQIKEHTLFVLNRTTENIKRLRKEDGR